MTTILGLDLGTNSIGWSLVDHDFINKTGEINALGCRVIPMDQKILGNFDAGVSVSQTAERTQFRGVRRLYQRSNLRRERLHRVLNILNFLPKHYAHSIDFEKKYGQFKEEVKLNYRKDENGKYQFIFMNSFNEMLKEFGIHDQSKKIPYDWTIYYLRKKALTEKISKEELAWLLLNFNQKRGYYQLRDEESDHDSTKIEEFHNLKVCRVETTDDKNDKGTWYNVILENAWIYRRQSKESLENWLGKNKEFIVTTNVDKDGNLKTDKDGNVKRSFREVDSEKDGKAINKKTEQDIKSSGKFICEFIFEALVKNPKQKIRGKLIKTIERHFYKKEFEQILRTQIEKHDELNISNKVGEENYLHCINELYPRNEAHQNSIKNKGFAYLFLDDIIFYQRPLKSKKSTISNCRYEKRYFVKDGNKEEQALKCISKSNPLYQEFRLWQFLKNLTIYQKEKVTNGDIKLDSNVTKELFKTEDDWVKLFDYLNSRKEVEQKNLITFMANEDFISKKDKNNYRWNYVEDKKYPMSDTYAHLLSRLKKVNNLDADLFLNKENLQKLWHLIYSVKDKKEYEQALKTFARKAQIDQDSFFEYFKKFPPFKNEYGAYSEKAIKKLLPLMRLGKYWNEEDIKPDTKKTIDDIRERLDDIDFDEKRTGEISDDFIPKQLLKSFCEFSKKSPYRGLNTHQACYAVYKLFSESIEAKKWESPDDINNYLSEFKQHSLRNPIVEQIITETLRVVRDIWKYHGNSEKNFFDEIHIELGRSMKNPANKRKKMLARVTENENTNYRIKELLKELMNDDHIEGDIRPYSTSHQEILKIYEEGVYNSQENISDDIEKIRKNSKPTKADISKYKLWLEQSYISPYTGRTIPLSKLFTTHYQIDHIIPRLRYFDNSLSNKIICESAVNQRKGNQTAYAFIKNHSGEIVELGQNAKVEIFNLENYVIHCNKHFKKIDLKHRKLLSEDIPDGFIERQLNDTRYISKLVTSLLSNIVREENELEATSKNIVPVVGAITSELKKHWGLNDKWNEIIKDRFIRLNALTKSEDFGFWDKKINAFRIQVPDDVSKGFSSKRIDHRHHALDALVIACCTRNHTQYLNALNAENTNYSLRNLLLKKSNKGDYTKNFLPPWEHFTINAKTELEKIIISFKQNTRVINKTNNKTWQWLEKNGHLKKELVVQKKGNNWAIRKSLHKEFVFGKLNWEAGKGKVFTARRVALSDIKNEKILRKISDESIQKILEKHLLRYENNYELAFSPEGIEQLNKDINDLNNGKKHQAIYKVRRFEEGKKFNVSKNENSPKSRKYVEAAKGSNLFFAIYWNEKKQRREYETIPFNHVIEHQKWRATLDKKKMKETPLIPLNKEKGEFLFSLSPNDLVYVPNNEEIENPNLVDFKNLMKEQIKRIFLVNDFNSVTIYFKPNSFATAITSKEVDLKFDKKNNKLFGSFDDKTANFNDISIKNICWKLKTDRLGNIVQQVLL